MSSRQQTTGSALGLRGYDQLDVVDENGVGVLYETLDSTHDRRIHVRVGRGADAERLRAAFSKWFRLSGHPNVVTVFNLVESPDGSVVAIESERTFEVLADRVGAAPGMPFVQVLAIGVGISSAIAELHLLGEVHGALDATSVALSWDDRPQLANIGLHTDIRATANDDVSALGSLLAFLLGASADRSADPTLDDPTSRWSTAPEVPGRVRELVDAAANGAVPGASELGDRLRELCILYTGRVPDGLGSQTGPGRQDPSSESSPGSDRTDGSGTRAEHQADRSSTASVPSMAEGPSVGWLDQHTDAGSSWFEDGQDVDEEPNATVGRPAASHGHGLDQPSSEAGGRSAETNRSRRWPIAILVAALAVAATGGALVLRNRNPPAPTTSTATDVDHSAGPALQSDSSRPDDSLVPPPGPPGQVRAEFLGPHGVRLAWTDNASVEEGYLIRVGHFERGADSPIREGWVGADGQLRDGWADPLPANTTSVDIDPDVLGDPATTLTCLQPVAVLGGRETVEAEEAPVCVPAGPPRAPTLTEPPPPLHRAVAGPLRFAWTSNSADHGRFVVIEVGAENQVIAHWSTADTELTLPLAPGDHRCFVVKAENVHNLAEPPTLHDDGSVSDPVCVEGKAP